MKVLVEDVQKALALLGLYTGRIDGIHGEYLSQAIMKFQTMNGLPVNGKYSFKLEQLLFPTPMADRQEQLDFRQDKVFGFPHDSTQALTDFYGKPGDNIVTVTLPYKMRLAWDLNTQVGRAQINIRCQSAYLDTLEQTLGIYGLDGIHDLGLDITGGTFNNRAIRGGTRPSTHAFGCAWDVDPARNGLKLPWSKCQLSKPEYDKFWQAVSSNGGVSLGEVAGYDGMHIQWAHRGVIL